MSDTQNFKSERDEAKSFFDDMLKTDAIEKPLLEEKDKEEPVVADVIDEPKDITTDEDLSLPDVDDRLKDLERKPITEEGDVDLENINLGEGKASENFRKIKSAAEHYKESRDKAKTELLLAQEKIAELETKTDAMNKELLSYKGEESKLLFETNNEYLSSISTKETEIKTRINSVANLHDLTSDVIEGILAKENYKEALAEAEEYIYDDIALRDLSAELKEFYLNRQQKSEVMNGNSQAREVLKKRFEEEKLRIKKEKMQKAPAAVESSFAKLVNDMELSLNDGVKSIMKEDTINWLKFFAAQGIDISSDLSDKFTKLVIKSYLHSWEKQNREQVEKEKRRIEGELDLDFPKIGNPASKGEVNWIRTDGTIDDNRLAEKTIFKY